MKFSSFSAIILGTILFLIISGCGTFSKMRYSRGFKSNIELSFGKNKDESEKRNIAVKATKKQNPSTATPPSEYAASELEIKGSTSPLLIKKEKKNLSIFPKKTQIQETISFVESSYRLQKASDDPKPIEPNIKLAGILFSIYWIISLIGGLILLALLFGLISIDPLLGLILLFIGALAAGILGLLSLIYAIVGLIGLIKSKGEYRGALTAILIIGWFILPLLLSLF